VERDEMRLSCRTIIQKKIEVESLEYYQNRIEEKRNLKRKAIKVNTNFGIPEQSFERNRES
jgi:hypothetical protein